MRIAILLALGAIAACSKPQAAAPPAIAGTYAGAGRDALCFASDGGPSRSGFITYGAGDANCSASGRLVGAGEAWELVPAGEGECRIPVSFGDGTVTLGAQSANCAYYCGPGASFAGKTFRMVPKPPAAVDLAGDPLC